MFRHKLLILIVLLNLSGICVSKIIELGDLFTTWNHPNTENGIRKNNSYQNFDDFQTNYETLFFLSLADKNKYKSLNLSLDDKRFIVWIYNNKSNIFYKFETNEDFQIILKKHYKDAWEITIYVHKTDKDGALKIIPEEKSWCKQCVIL